MRFPHHLLAIHLQPELLESGVVCPAVQLLSLHYDAVAVEEKGSGVTDALRRRRARCLQRWHANTQRCRRAGEQRQAKGPDAHANPQVSSGAEVMKLALASH
eukprot:scaffold21569_cov107-Isochrysis_galbana.AAC.10